MKLSNVAAAAVIGVGATLGAGLTADAPRAQADPPGTHWCWSHLMPVAQACPAIPPWGTRWTACPDGLFVLDGNTGLCGTSGYDPNQTYTFNCWGRQMILGRVCPPTPPGPNDWRVCPNIGHDVWTLDGECTKP